MRPTRLLPPRARRGPLVLALLTIVTACGGTEGEGDCPAPSSATEAAAEPSPCDEGGGSGY